MLQRWAESAPPREVRFAESWPRADDPSACQMVEPYQALQRASELAAIAADVAETIEPRLALGVNDQALKKAVCKCIFYR
jgi:hypothetical protein